MGTREDSGPSETSLIPDPKKHQQISFVKSAFRILAGLALAFNQFGLAGALIIIAEVLGIAEEMV